MKTNKNTNKIYLISLAILALVQSITLGQIDITSPVGGEDWEVASQYDIEWTSAGTSGFVKIEYTINGTYWNELVASTPDNGSYSWTIPDSVSSNCLIRVSDTDDDPSDVSDAVFSISAARTIAITSPNGGEDWQVASSQSITWTSTGSMTDVHIEYSTNSGTNWSEVVVSTPNDGTYDWTIPDDVSTTCLIRISDLDDDPSDVSDAVFTISPVPSITVVAPNGGEDWTVGSTQDITWTSTGFANVHIEYSTDNGSNWGEVIASTPDDGTHQWTVPDEASALCLIRVSDTDADPSDLSDAVFTISSVPAITVTAPNGGEDWVVGTTQDITWTSTGFTNVHIEYSLNNGGVWSDVVASTPDDGTHAWTIPDAPSTECLIRISDTDDDPSDVSDATFTISPVPTLTLTSPNGAEDWQVASGQNITWTSTGTISNVHLEYSVDNGSSWDNIIASTPNDGTHPWTIPDDPSVTCLVRVSDIDADPSDESDAVFTISSIPFMLVGFPNGGEELHVGASEEITWTSATTSGNVKIEFSSDNGSNWDEIIASTPDDGSFDWTIPDEVSVQCLIRISDTDTDPLDASDAVFSISPMPLIDITSPNGGEDWEVSSTEDITWTSVNTSGNVMIEYSVNNGSSWNTIIASTPDDGTHPWVIPDAPSTNCIVRITDVDLDPVDVSDALFTISPIPFVSLSFPVGGESFQVGSTQTISWTSSGTPGTVTLGFSSNNELNWTYTYNIPDNGSYEWTVPDAPSTECVISVCGSGWDPCDKTSVFAITSIPAIFVNSPEGGENWIVGTTENITWNSVETGANVRIEYSTDNGTSWSTIVANTPNDGEYAWIIPNDISETCLVRIIDVDGDPSGVSESVFTIAPVPFVNLISPLGGESFEAGTVQTIAWTSSGTNGFMTLGFSSNNEQNWTYIYSIPDNGTYEWTVPNTPSTECVISLCGSGWDPCDKTTLFTVTAVPEITLTAPEGGENWIVGTSEEITWNSVETGNTVEIEYSTDNAASWSTIVANTPNDGVYNWTVPDDISDSCLIRITDLDGDPQGVSGSVFKISPVPFVNLISPIGGENFEAGSVQTIEWTSSGTNGFMTFGFSTDNEASWTYTYSIPDTGSYEWTVPNTPSTECVISLCGSGFDPCDETSIFTVTAIPTYIVTAPAGGENWHATDSVTITWTSVETSGNVQIEYSTNKGITWTEIVANTADDGEHDWLVPNEISSNCLVRITNVAGEPQGISEAEFSILSEPYIIISSPQGGEDYLLGSTQEVRWTSSGITERVIVGYSYDGGVSWTYEFNVPNTGSHFWTVPMEASEHCIISVSDSDWDPFDEIDTEFAISETGTTDLHFTDSEEIIVYPNPAQNSVNIKFGNYLQEEKQVKISDIKGRVVFSQSYNYVEEILNINLDEFDSGMYFLEIVSDGKTQTSILVKE